MVSMGDIALRDLLNIMVDEHGRFVNDYCCFWIRDASTDEDITGQGDWVAGVAEWTDKLSAHLDRRVTRIHPGCYDDGECWINIWID